MKRKPVSTTLKRISRVAHECDLDFDVSTALDKLPKDARKEFKKRNLDGTSFLAGMVAAFYEAGVIVDGLTGDRAFTDRECLDHVEAAIRMGSVYHYRRLTHDLGLDAGDCDE